MEEGFGKSPHVAGCTYERRVEDVASLFELGKRKGVELLFVDYLG